MGIQYSSFLTATPSCGESHPWPYELYQGAGHFEKTFGNSGSGNFVYHPGFTLDWMKEDPSIFCVESGCPTIKADWLRPSVAPGYEGTRKVAGMIIDGTNMLRHHLDSMGPAYFFTHELNIGMLEDRNEGLDKAFAGVFENIKKFHDVIPCGWDYFNQYNKNVRTIDVRARLLRRDTEETKRSLQRFFGYSHQVPCIYGKGRQDNRYAVRCAGLSRPDGSNSGS